MTGIDIKNENSAAMGRETPISMAPRIVAPEREVPIAHADAFEREGMDETVRRNRRLLHHAMRQAGFTHYSAEWWHFDYGDGPWARRTHSAPLYAFCAEGDLR